MNNMFKTFKKITSCALSTVITLSSIVLTQSTVLKAAPSDFDCVVETKPIKQLDNWCWITSTQMALRSFLQKEGKLKDNEYIHSKYGEKCIEAINAYYEKDEDPRYFVEETLESVPVAKKSMGKFEELYNKKMPDKDKNDVNKEAAFLVYISSYRLEIGETIFTMGLNSEIMIALDMVLRATGLASKFAPVDLSLHDTAGNEECTTEQKLGMVYNAVKANNSVVISQSGNHYKCITGIKGNHILVQETSGSSAFEEDLDYLKNQNIFTFIIDKTKDNMFFELNPDKQVYNNGETVKVLTNKQLLDASLQVKSDIFDLDMCVDKDFRQKNICSRFVTENSTDNNDGGFFYNYDIKINKNNVPLKNIVDNSKLNGKECMEVSYISVLDKELAKITYVPFTGTLKAPDYESIFGKGSLNDGCEFVEWLQRHSKQRFKVGEAIDIASQTTKNKGQLCLNAIVKTNITFNVYYEDNGSYPSKPNISEKTMYTFDVNKSDNILNLNSEIPSLEKKYSNNNGNKYVLDKEKTKKDAEKYLTNYERTGNSILPARVCKPTELNLYFKKDSETAVVSFKVEDQIVKTQTVSKGSVGVNAPKSVELNGVLHNILRWKHETDDKISVQNVIVNKDMTFIAEGVSPANTGASPLLDDSGCYLCYCSKKPNNTAIITDITSEMMKNILSSSVAELDIPPVIKQNGCAYNVEVFDGYVDCCMKEIPGADSKAITITVPNSVTNFNLGRKGKNPITLVFKNPKTKISKETLNAVDHVIFPGLPNKATHDELKNNFHKVTYQNGKKIVAVIYSKKNEYGKSQLLNPKDHGITDIDKWYTVNDQVVDFSRICTTDLLFSSKRLNAKVFTQTEDRTGYKYRPKYSFNVEYPYGASRAFGSSGVFGASRQGFEVSPIDIEGYEYNQNHEKNKTVLYNNNDTVCFYYDIKQVTSAKPITKKPSNSGPKGSSGGFGGGHGNKSYSNSKGSFGGFGGGHGNKSYSNSKGSFGGFGSGGSGSSGGSGGSGGYGGTSSSKSSNTANQTPNSSTQGQIANIPIAQKFEFEANRLSPIDAVAALSELVKLTNILGAENKAIVFNTNKIDDQGQKQNLATWYFEKNQLKEDFVTKAKEIMTIQEKANAHQTSEAENTRLAQLKKEIDIYNFKLSVKQSSAEENTTLFEAAKQKLAGHNATVIDFTENKVFPGEAVVSVNLGKDKSNKEYIVVYVYKDEKTGLIVTKILSENCKVEANGYVNFRASHGANYVFLEKSDDNLKLAKELELTR